MPMDGGAKEARTPDLLNAIQTLYQLSYDPIHETEAQSKFFALQVKTFSVKRRDVLLVCVENYFFFIIAAQEGGRFFTTSIPLNGLVFRSFAVLAQWDIWAKPLCRETSLIRSPKYSRALSCAE